MLTRIVTLLLVACCCCCCCLASTIITSRTNAKRSSLLFATVIHRHGQRTPFHPYPNDPYASAAYFPQGWGQLTNAGKRQLFELGTWLRRRYLGAVLQRRYHSDHIRFESTDMERTLQSAVICAAGMYPPDAEDRWSDDDAISEAVNGSGAVVAFQAVAVHTMPMQLDDRVWFGRPCPAYERNSEEAQRQIVSDYRRRHADEFDYVSRHSGSPLGTAKQV